MLRFKQLDFFLQAFGTAAPPRESTSRAPTCDHSLEAEACRLSNGLALVKLAPLLRVEWNPRLRTAAGRADFRRSLISLNPRLHAHGQGEIDRTLRHELAHLIAHARAGRRRIAPHGPEWRQACHDLGIAGEERCHTLPFPTQRRARRFLYRCPRCAMEFPRVRRVRRTMACLACCRRYNRGKFAAKFQLQLVAPVSCA